MNRETIISKLAPELFPSIQPSLEYLAEDVPVPIPSPNSGYVCLNKLITYFQIDFMKQNRKP